MSSYQENLSEAIAVFQSLGQLESELALAGRLCVDALTSGHKLMVCGNGGSSAEAQHLTGELMGRYKESRVPLPAISLPADAAVLTCIGNDYAFDEIFSRQTAALGNPGDILVAFTTSGNSPNILKALAVARERGMKSVAFLGCEGGKARSLADCALVVRHINTARAQEGHQFLMHTLMDAIEAGVRDRIGHE